MGHSSRGWSYGLVWTVWFFWPWLGSCMQWAYGTTEALLVSNGLSWTTGPWAGSQGGDRVLGGRTCPGPLETWALGWPHWLITPTVLYWEKQLIRPVPISRWRIRCPFLRKEMETYLTKSIGTRRHENLGPFLQSVYSPKFYPIPVLGLPSAIKTQDHYRPHDLDVSQKTELYAHSLAQSASRCHE